MQDVFKPGLLRDRHAVITGAGSGINKRIAELFSRHGARVSIVGRNADRCAAAAVEVARHGGQAMGLPADVRDHPTLSRALAGAVAHFGPIDICIAGAAGNFVSRADEMSSNGFKTVVDIDLVGTFNTFHAAFPLIREGGADFLAVSAVQGVMPMATQAHVCAAKAGIEILVRTLAIEWADRGVRCVAIAPGPVEGTEGMRRLAPEGEASWARLLEGIPMRRGARLDEIAELALFLCSGAARYIHGTVVTIDGGQTNLGSLPFGRMLAESLAAG